MPNSSSPSPFLWRSRLPVGVLISCLVLAAILLIFLYAPEEQTMGNVQRILYLHVSVAWCGLAGFVMVGTMGVVYLWGRNLAWDQWAQAAAETGWLCTTLTLATGSLWAHEAWNTWWTWEPRLTASLILWTIYAGYFLVRAGAEDPHRRARIGAALGILGMVDIPMIVMATRWFRGIHPIAPEMEPRMRLVLLVSVVSFTAFFVLLTLYRRRQLLLTEQLAALERQLAASPEIGAHR